MTKETSWRSLSEAAAYLGVHFTTLRRWADNGLIEYMRTPGGKRKFRQQVLDDFLEQHRNAAKEQLALVKLQDEALLRTRASLQSPGIAQLGWYSQLSDEQRAQMRGSGSRLVVLMLQFCAREANGEVFLEEARRITRDYGDFCYDGGLSLTECIQAFLLFRRPMLHAFYETGSLKGSSDAADLPLFERMTTFLDEIMVAMAHRYGERKEQDTLLDR